MTITVGTKIKITNTKYSTVPNGSIMTVTFAHIDGDIEATLDGGDGFEWFLGVGTYEVLEDDTQDTPTLWKDMTPEEKGALLLANHEGRGVQVWSGVKWLDNCTVGRYQGSAYRIAPAEPVVDGVELYYGNWGYASAMGADSATHRITFDTIDGVPDTGSIKMFEV